MSLDDMSLSKLQEMVMDREAWDPAIHGGHKELDTAEQLNNNNKHISTVLLQSVSQSVQLFSHVRLFVTPWTAAHQASLSINSSQSLLKLMSIESVIPSNHLILCCPLLLLPSVFPSIRVFPKESVLCIK